MWNGPGIFLLAWLGGPIFCTFIFGIVSVHLLWMFFLDLLILTLVLYPVSIALFFLLSVLRMGDFLLVMISFLLVVLRVWLYLRFLLFPRSRLTPSYCLKIFLLLTVVKFGPIFGSLYLAVTLHQLFLFDMDCPVTDLAWKLLMTSFFNVPLLSQFFPGFNLLCFIGPQLLLPYYFAMLYLVLILVSFLTSREFLFIF